MWSSFDIKGQEKMVHMLRKALYGLKQAPRASDKRIDIFLIKLGFNKCTSEHGVYVKWSNEQDQVILCLYVYDLFVTCSNEK